MTKHFTKIKSENTFKQISDLADNPLFDSIEPGSESNCPTSLPLYNKEDHKYYGRKSLLHTMVIGPSGSGKSSDIIIPQIYNHMDQGGPLLSICSEDVLKATLPKANELGYKTYVLNLANLEQSDSYNGLESIKRLYNEGTPGSQHLAIQQLGTTCHLLLTTNGMTKDIYWEGSGIKSSKGTGCLMLCSDRDGEFNLPYLYETITTCFGNIDECTRLYQKYVKKEPGITDMRVFLFNAPNTRNCIHSVISERFGAFCQDKLTKYIFSHHDFPDFTTIRDQKVAMYIVLPFHAAKNYLPIVKIFLLDLIQGLTTSNVRLNDETQSRFLISCDEFASYAFEELADYISNSRKYNIEWTLAMQSLSQLDKIGPDFKATIMENCMIKVYLAMNNLQAMKEISQNSGDVTIYYDNKTIVRNAITMNDLKEMPPNSAFIQYGNLTIFDYLTPYYTMKEYSNLPEYMPRHKITNNQILFS